MNNQEFLDTVLHLLEALIFQKIIQLPDAFISYSDTDTSPFWNNALVSEVITEEELKTIEDTFEKIHRGSTIYFENKPELQELKTLVEQQGYKKIYEDSWMFFHEDTVSTTGFDKVKKIVTEEDLQVFLQTLNACYQKDDPQNPYGEIGAYLQLFEKAWHVYHEKGIDCFVAYDGDQPVAVATLNTYKGIGYISNVGSLRSVRGKGFGKLITLSAVKASQEKGNTIHCLATEEGTYPNDFYKRIGFQTKFTAIAYSK